MIKREYKKYDNLDSTQKGEVWTVEACGHLANIPKDEKEAKKRLWVICEAHVIGWRE